LEKLSVTGEKLSVTGEVMVRFAERGTPPLSTMDTSLDDVIRATNIDCAAVCSATSA